MQQPRRSPRIHMKIGVLFSKEDIHIRTFVCSYRGKGERRGRRGGKTKELPKGRKAGKTFSSAAAGGVQLYGRWP